MRTSQSMWRNIGVTGFTRPIQVLDTWMHFARLCDEHNVSKHSVQPRFMTGVLVSSNTLRGLPQEYPKQYPTRDQLCITWPEVHPESVLKLVHYNTNTPENLLDEATQVVKLMEGTMDGFQFNVCWPDPSVFHHLKRMHPKLYILLQVGEKALRPYASVHEAEVFGFETRYDTQALRAKVREYAGAIDEVLIDPSGGEGKSFNPTTLRPVISVLAEFDSLNLAIAGGLSAHTMSNVKPLLPACPHLGIDAQKRLRNPETDELDMRKVHEYMNEAFQLFYPKQIDRRVNDMRELDMLVRRYTGGRNDDGMSGGIPRG